MTLLTEFKEAVIIAWAALWANKLRAGLTVARKVGFRSRSAGQLTKIPAHA